MRNTKKMLAVFVVAALPASASAGWYGAVSAGQSRTSKDLVSNRESTIVRASNFQTDFDATDSAYRIGAGYQFSEIIAVEVNYADLGSHHMVTTMLAGDPALYAAIAVDRKITGFGADVVASLPVAERFSLRARAGAFRSKLKADASLDGNILFTNGNTADRQRSTTQNETVFRYGVGAAWELWRNGALHVEWERYNKVGKAFEVGGSGTTGEADTDAYWIGVTQRF